MVAMLSASSAGPYIPDMPMQPRARGNTVGPLEPRARASVVGGAMSDDESAGGRRQGQRCVVRPPGP